MDMGALDSRAGQIVVAAALVDNALSLVLLAVRTGTIRQGHVPGGLDLRLLVGRVAAFFVVAVAPLWRRTLLAPRMRSPWLRCCTA